MPWMDWSSHLFAWVNVLLRRLPRSRMTDLRNPVMKSVVRTSAHAMKTVMRGLIAKMVMTSTIETVSSVEMSNRVLTRSNATATSELMTRSNSPVRTLRKYS